MSATLTIGGTQYIFLEDSLTISKTTDERQRLQCTVIDYAGTTHFTHGMQVTLTDPALGTRFSGFVNTAKEIQEYPSGAIEYAIDCIDLRYLPDKRTYTRTYTTPAYAGKIVVDHLRDVLAAEGIAQNYALHFDTTQADFTTGILTNTVGTSNVGDGDLELSLAGSTATILEHVTSDFAAGTLTNCQAQSNSLVATPTNALKLTGTQNISSTGNTFVYWTIWNSGAFSMTTNMYLTYDIWIASTSPQQYFGVDLVFTDDSSLRDFSQYNDAQNIRPHPETDLAGYATNQWYHRSFKLDNFSGKTLAISTFACEGNSVGNYTGYVKNVQIVNGSGTTLLTIFGGSLNVNPPIQASNYGYSTSAVTVVPTYDLSACQRISSAYSIDAAKLVRSSYISWSATTPVGNKVLLSYSLDGTSYLACTNNTSLPSFPAGLSIAGKSITIKEQLVYDTSGNVVPSPETTPTLTQVQVTIQSAYNATKTDVTTSYLVTSDWTAGTLSNTISSNNLTLNGFVRNWVNADLSSIATFGNGVVSLFVNRKTLALTCSNNNDARARMDSAGTWADFTAEVDIQVIANGDCDLEYRTTNFGNNTDSYAYVAALNLADVRLIKGTNSSGAGGATTITITNFFSALAAGSWHRLKVIASGSSHQVYVDGNLMITATDGTYTSAGYLSLRTFNGSGSNQTAYFDNFGVDAVLSGTWTSANVLLTPASSYGNSVITWSDISTSATPSTIKVEATINGGSTWQTCTNGAAIPNFSVGQSLSGVNLQLRATLTTSEPNTLPGLGWLVARVLGAFSASGTRSTAPLGNDTFVRANQSGFGTAFDGQTWAKSGTGTDAISSNTGTITNTTGDVHEVLGSRTWTDEDGTVRFQLSAASQQAGLELRYTNTSNFYRFSTNTTQCLLLKVVSGTSTTLTTGTVSLSTSSSYRMRFRIQGSNLYGRIWADGTLEPTTWNITTTDSALTSGGFALFANGSGTTTFDSFRITEYPDPALILATVTPRIGSTAISWNATVPTNTTLGMDTSLDGVNWTDVTSQNGGSVPGIYSQPDPSIDGFSANTSANYTNTFRTGGSTATVTYDTTNTRLVVTSGVNGLYVYNAISRADVDFFADMDRSDAGGLVWRYIDANNFYYAVASDTMASAGTTNTITLYKVASNVQTTLSTATIAVTGAAISTFVRGTYHRFRISMLGGVITVYFDGVQQLTYTDGSPLGAGLMGLYNNGGTVGSRFYQLFLQPVGDSVTGTPSGDTVTGKFIYTRQRPASTDPTATPQVLDVTTVAFTPNISNGVSIPSVSYNASNIAKNVDDLAKQSNFITYIDESKNLIFRKSAIVAAPWILQSAPSGLVGSVDLEVDNLELDVSGDLYRNRQIVLGAQDTITITNEQHTGDGSTRNFTLGYPLASAPSSITLNGVTKTFALKGTSGSNFYYALSDPIIVQDSSQSVLQPGDQLIVSYTGLITVTVTVDNTTEQANRAAVEGGTGIVESVEDRSGQGLNKAAATTLANQLLSRYAVTGRTIIFLTSRDGLAVGQTLSIFLPEHGISNGQFAVQQVEITLRKGISDTQIWWYKVTASELPKQDSWAKLIASGLGLS